MLKYFCIIPVKERDSFHVLFTFLKTYPHLFLFSKVDPSRYDDPFVFATFRSLCSWLAEETSCLKEEVTGLLPFLIGYSRSHLQGESPEQRLSEWMATMSVSEERGSWTGREALR